MKAGFASWPCSAVVSVSIAPAEKPIMPIRSGSTFHSSARLRTRANAARASSSCGASIPAASLAPGSRGGRGPESMSRIDLANPSRSSGVWLRRYLSTNAATPRSASARAPSQPSFSIDSERKPPPGATMTAAPVALAGSGRNGVSVASVTLRANTRSYWRCQASLAVAPGNGPVPRTMASGWAGIAIGTMVSSCAAAADAHSRLAAASSRRQRRTRGGGARVGVMSMRLLERWRGSAGRGRRGSSRQRPHAVDGERGGPAWHAGPGLARADRDAIAARHHHPLARAVDRAQAARVEFEHQVALLARLQVHALESAQRQARQALAFGELQIQLGNLVAGALAGVAHLHADAQTVGSAAGGRLQLQRRIVEAGVAQAVSERIHRRAGEVAVGAPAHVVVAERRQVVDRAVEGQRQAPGGVEMAGDRVR